eukprot:CAMPEP_0197028598 /NCGR_PEP_ID=MMETSP1384-20130603/8245_1 /TAXON_ID=29189 /ORGANISM="Ammonia sp." /LENGTH=1787 /DNA_ID=CAMNT_0042457619 /DNA_START=164 /DNA_END=5527 /DNA_ORIENTATION=+
MGAIVDKCKSVATKSRSTPQTINETHLEKSDKDYHVTRKFEDEFLKNTEDLIQEITAHSKWQHYETRYLLSQFRKLADSKQSTNLSAQQFINFLPTLLRSFHQTQFQESHKLYKKWQKNFLKLFSSANDQITFQSFALTLNAACRGEKTERAQLLFDIFDVDRDGVLNGDELDLLLYCLFNLDLSIPHNDNATTDGPSTETTQQNASTDNHPAFDVNKLIVKEKVIEYIHELISPSSHKKKKKETADAVSNGQTANHPTDSNVANDGEVTEHDDNAHKLEHNDSNKDATTESPENGDNDANHQGDADDNNGDDEAINDENIAPADATQDDEDDLEDLNKKSSDTVDAEIAERIPLKRTQSEEEIHATNIDFLANVSLNDLNNCDDATFVDTVAKLLRNKLYNKNKLKKESFIEFASQCFNFDVLFASFMIIPTREDECRIIRELMQQTQMTLGASWFVINKTWWDQWCAYSGYTESAGSNHNDTELKNNDDDDTNVHMDAPQSRALRPIKISNRELLDENSIFTVLQPDLQQNNQFILLPKGAWEQLHEWYGGGPVIERYVISTDTQTRLDVINMTLPKLQYEYEQQKKSLKEQKKKKSKEKKKTSDDDDDDSNDNDEAQEKESKKSKTKKGKDDAFDVDKWYKQYQAKLEEVSIMAHPDTLRVDLYPIYINFVRINEKNQINDEEISEFKISRYATLPELYINICARMGYSIEDIQREKLNYKLYLQSKLTQKAKERQKNAKEDKKSKKKDKEDKKAPMPKIDLPPRLWTVIRNQRMGINIDKLLYPIPKLEQPASDDKKSKSKEKAAQSDETPKAADKADEAVSNGAATQDQHNETDDATANATDDPQAAATQPDDETNDNGTNTDAQTNDDAAAKDKESAQNVTDDPVDKDNNANENEKDKVAEADGDKDAATKSDNEQNEEDDEDDEDELDLHTIGLRSGVHIAVEFPHANKKKDGVLEYKLRSSEEDQACEPEPDDSWLDFADGQRLDGRDRWGKWYEAVIKKYKKAGEPMPKKAKLTKLQEKDIKELEKLEAIFIHYTAWEDKWDEWIFIKPEETICKCRTFCATDKSKHRLAALHTQSKMKPESHGGGGGRHGYARSSGMSGDSGWGYGRGRESVRGAPSTAGCVGLVNLGNTCFMASIIQCISHTPHFRTFFTSGQYKQDINKTNPLGMKGELAHEFAKLVSDIWSGEYKVIAPRSLKKALSKFAPQFSGWQQHDSQEFLAFLLDGLHEDLNLVKTKPYTDKIEAQGRSDEVVADLSWKIYLKRNKSKIVDLFQAQQRSHVICPDCNRNSITFDTYMYLSVPIVGHSTKSLIIDVFHRRTVNEINKPIRHVFHVNKYQKVRDLAKMIANIYETKDQFVLFYENWNMKVTREYDHNLMLGMVPNREALACYILKDWNEEVTPEEIKKKKLSLQLAKLCHSQPLDENGRFSGSGGPLFGMPFVISFLNVHSRREVHQVVYQRLFAWVGAETLPPPPSLVKLERVKKEQDEKPETNGKDKEKDKKKKKEDDNEEEEDVEYIRPTQEQLDAYEAEWDKIFESLPYNLRLMPYRHYSFYSSKSTPEIIPIDSVPFEKSIRTKDIDIMIEWNADAYSKIQGVVNKVVVDGEYSKWKKEKAAKSQQAGNEQLTLYDCINAYVAQETLGENDLWYCSECKKHEKANKKLDLWSFPEIMIIHLKRFQVLGVGRFGRGEKISTFVECPIRQLDLTPYVINKTSTETKPIYDLYAVSCHSGSCGGGHYTAYALNSETDRWYFFNDTSVRPAKESEIISTSSYVLFYKKCH